MRCIGVSAFGNQCQNNAGIDGLCCRHRGKQDVVPAKVQSVTLICRSCACSLKIRKAAIKRNFYEKPEYYLCHVCNRTYKHEKPDGFIVVHHGSIGSFSAFTVRMPTEDEAESVLRAKALVAQVSWPNGYGDV